MVHIQYSPNILHRRPPPVPVHLVNANLPKKYQGKVADGYRTASRSIVHPEYIFSSHLVKLADGAEVPARWRLIPGPMTFYMPAQVGCFGECAFCEFKGDNGRNLSVHEIHYVLETILPRAGLLKKNAVVEFTEMGDAAYNTANVLEAISRFKEWHGIERVEICSSVPGPSLESGITWQKMYEPWLQALAAFPSLLLRVSLHYPTNKQRFRAMNPGKTPMLNHENIIELGRMVHAATRRKLFLNYMVHPSTTKDADIDLLFQQFSPEHFAFALSPVNLNKSLKPEQIPLIQAQVRGFGERLKRRGYTVVERFSAGWASGMGNGRHLGPQELEKN